MSDITRKHLWPRFPCGENVVSREGEGSRRTEIGDGERAGVVESLAPLCCGAQLTPPFP